MGTFIPAIAMCPVDTTNLVTETGVQARIDIVPDMTMGTVMASIGRFMTI